MINIARHDHSIFARWWWRIDRITLMLLITLITIGITMIWITGPIIADRIHQSHNFFIHKTICFIPITLSVMFIASLLSPRQIKRLCIILFPIVLILLIMTKIDGLTIKGSQRWLELYGITIQPSEFAKPIFIVLSSVCITAQAEGVPIPGYLLSFVMYIILAVLFLIQPDFGQTLLLSFLWIMQIFLTGLPLVFLFAFFIIGGISIIISYFVSPHVQIRINDFITSKNFQANTALHAFQSGGFLGRGALKIVIPDSHADFVFAAMGEIFGTLICSVVIVIFSIILLRTLYRLLKNQDLFILNAGGTLLSLFCLQSIISMASSLSLIPTKGMTLPFIAYGGSSSISMGLTMGFVLALTKKPL